MIERSGLYQIKALNLLFPKNNVTPIISAPTVYIYNPRHKHVRFGDYGTFKDSPAVYFYHNRSYE